MTWTQLDEYRAQVRERYYKLTPYRLGFVVGEALDDPALCPYEKTHASALFHQGHKHGKEHRERTQALDKQEAP